MLLNPADTHLIACKTALPLVKSLPSITFWPVESSSLNSKKWKWWPGKIAFCLERLDIYEIFLGTEISMGKFSYECGLIWSH